MGANFQSDAIGIADYVGCSLQAVFTGVPDGVISLQASNDVVGTPQEVINWTEVGNSASIITSSGSVLWNINSQFKWLRVKYDYSSGSGSCNITFMAKEV
jgi:hypothetical protein